MLSVGLRRIYECCLFFFLSFWLGTMHLSCDMRRRPKSRVIPSHSTSTLLLGRTLTSFPLRKRSFFASSFVLRIDLRYYLLPSKELHRHLVRLIRKRHPHDTRLALDPQIGNHKVDHDARFQSHGLRYLRPARALLGARGRQV
jgi:hypothetical protein